MANQEIFRNIQRYEAPDNARRIFATLDAYGVDHVKGSTFLGSGAFKVVHRTNIPETVAMISQDSRQFDHELMLLDLLGSSGFPALKYHSVERFGGVIIALADRLYAPDGSWDEDRTDVLKEEVKSLLSDMIEEGYYMDDLQFMVDRNGHPVFTDPLKLQYITHEPYQYCIWDGQIHVDACCKDNRSQVGTVCASKRINR
ncbi:MAG: hypothetical protein ACWGQW_01595 [bacterium]